MASKSTPSPASRKSSRRPGPPRSPAGKRRSRSKLADDRAQLIAKLPRGLTIPEVAARLRISEQHAGEWCRQYGYATRRINQAAEPLKKLPPHLTYRQIAERLGISYAVAINWVKKIGYPARILPRGRPPEIGVRRAAQIRELPPGLTIAQVARRLKISEVAAATSIRQAQYPFRRAEGSGRSNLKVQASRWRTINWKMRDSQIARLLGVSRERVRQVRLRENKPKAHLPK